MALLTDDANSIYAFRRQHEKEVVIAVFNIDTAERSLALPLARPAQQNWQEVSSGQQRTATGQELAMVIPPRTAQIWTQTAAE